MAVVGEGDSDVETLSFPDDAFDVVLSNFGHVVAPNSTAAGAKMCRTSKPGGRVAFTAWSPDGVVGDLTRVLMDHLTDPVADPWDHLRWGDREFVEQQVGERASLSFQRRILRFRYVSPHYFRQEFAEESGALSPTIQRMDDEDVRAALREDVVSALDQRFGDDAVRVEYLQVRAIIDGLTVDCGQQPT